MPACNPYLMITTRTLIDSWIRGFSAWCELFIKVAVVVLLQIPRVFVIGHSASFPWQITGDFTHYLNKVFCRHFKHQIP